MSTAMTLLSFSGVDTTRQLAASLEGLGQQVTAIEGPSWLRRPAPLPGPILTLLGPERLGPELVPTLAAHLDVERVLVVFAGTDAGDALVLCLSAEIAFWPCSAQELDLRLTRLRQRAQVVRPGASEAGLDGFRRLNLIGQSAPFQTVLGLVQRIAPCDVPVLLQGETGTGKELFARAIHYLGPRQDGAFVPVNCGAIPPTLMESEFFGHARGAFTDAREARTGLVELAHGGTLFLDEIDGLAPQGQVSLLRFLQGHEFRPLGDRRFRHADVRIVAAANRPLEALVRQGVLREDLFFRLNLFPIELPALRHRGDDVIALAEHFLERFRRRYGWDGCALTGDARAWLRRHPWPGNVRELENVVHRACLLAQGRAIHTRELLGEALLGHDDAAAPPLAPEQSFADAKQAAVCRFERAYLEGLLRTTRGNVSSAARIAGKERRALGKLLKKHGLHRRDFT